MDQTGQRHLKTIEQRLLWLSHWMIHNANHIRPKSRRHHHWRPSGLVSVDGVDPDGAVLQRPSASGPRSR